MLNEHGRVVAITPVASTEWYVVDRDYAFIWDGVKTIVSRRFLFNGASIPCFAWQITTTPYSPRIIRAALVHDFLYATHRTGDGNTISRRKADMIFREICIADGIGKVKCWIMYWALRIGGCFAWRNGIKETQRVEAARRSKTRQAKRNKLSYDDLVACAFPPQPIQRQSSH